MQTIGDFTGKIIKILDVIDGTTLSDEMIQNILAIYFTPKLKKELLLLLKKYQLVFDPLQINIQGFKPGTVILGPYSSGKSHFALFVAFLLGLDINFSDPILKEEIPNIREKCWEILEKEENLGNQVKEVSELRINKYLVSFVSLTNYREESDFLSIIVDTINRTLESHGIPQRIGIESTEKNRSIILDYMKNSNPTYYKEYSLIKKNRRKLLFLKDFANKHDLRLKLKTNKEIANELKIIAQENGYKGFLLFFDEFFRYYNPQENKSKIKIGSILQSFAYEIQNDVRLGILPISQEPIFESDEFLQQVERRFSKVTISYESATSIIHKRLIPEVNLTAIENFYRNRFFFYPDTSMHRKRITLDVFKDYYPFHKKTITDLQKFVGYYANDTKGIINYLWYALNEESLKDADQLITANTLYDYFISDLNSPEMRGYELKEKYEEVKEQYISKIDTYTEREMSKKMLKILLFCTNRSISWSLDDFYNHFYDHSERDIRDILENLVQYIENHSNFISANISRKNFYYNPGGRGDINRYISIIERAIFESKVLDFYWNESMSDRLQGQSLKKEIFEWKKVLCKSYCVIPVKEDLDRTIDEGLKMLTDLPEKDLIFGYEFDQNLLIDAVFIIDKQNSSYKTDNVETKINSKIKDQKRILGLSDLEFSLYYVKPLSFSKTEIQKIKNYYARKICLTIFELVSIKKDYIWDQLKNTGTLRRYKDFLNDTIMDMNLKQFLSENKEIISRYITNIKVTLSPVEKDEAIMGFLRDNNINDIFMDSLNKANIFDTKSWIDYSLYNKNFDNIIKETMETLIPLKYPMLFDLIVMDTKKLYNKYLTGILNLLVKHVFIDNYEFRITDNKTKQVLTTTFKELNLIEEVEGNDFRFNEKFSLENKYFKRFNELFKDKDKVEIIEIILEYLKPPYGFPKIITFLMLLALVHMQKFIFSLQDMEISSLTDIKSSIGIRQWNKRGVDDLIRRGFMAKGDIISKAQFKAVKMIVSTLINFDGYNTYKNIQDNPRIVDFDTEPLKRFIKDIIGINMPSLNHQNHLIELINTLQVTTELSSFEVDLLSFHEKLIKYLKENTNLEYFEPFEFENFDLISKILNLTDFLNEIQGIESSGKTTLIEFVKIFDEKFCNEDFKDSLTEIFSLLNIMKDKNSNMNLISEGIDFLIKTSGIQEEDWIRSQHQKIITDISEVITNPRKFMNIIKKGEFEVGTKIKDPLEKNKEIFINHYKKLHSKLWSIISAYKDNYESSEQVLVKTIENISHLKIKTSYGQEKINLQLKICNNYNNLNDKKIIEEIGCSECKFYFNSDFELTIILGCRYSISISNLIGTESSEIISDIDIKLTDFLINQILKIFESFRCEEGKETLGRNIIEKISYELNQDEREAFLECTKTNKDFNYPKVKNMFLNKSEMKSERRNGILLALEFIYRVGLTLGFKDTSSIINQANAINIMFENISFVEFLNDLIEVNLSPLDKIKRTYGIFQIEDLLSFEPQTGINNLANNQIHELYKKRIKDYGKMLIIPHSKYEFIDDLYYDIQEHNLNLSLLKLNKPIEERSISKINKSLLQKGNNCFFAYEQIIVMNQKMQKELQTLIRSIFPNCYYFGELELAREFFYNKSIKYIEIYIKDNNKWTKWGYIQKLFGCIEEYKYKEK